MKVVPALPTFIHFRSLVCVFEVAVFGCDLYLQALKAKLLNTINSEVLGGL